MICKFECFWPNFEMMTWQHGARNSRFWENSFIKVYLTSKFLLLLSFIFLSPLVHEIQVWVLFRASFGLMTSPRWDKTSKILSEEFHKRAIHLKGPFTSDFHLSINIGALNTNFDLLTHFLVDCITTGSQHFEILRWFQKRILYLKFPYTIDFHLSINTIEIKVYEIKVWALFDSSLLNSIKYWFRSFFHPRYIIYNYKDNIKIMTSRKK